MKKALIAFVFLVSATFFPTRQLHAQAGAGDAALAVVRSGMDAYKAKGADEAMKAWIKGSPIDGSKEALSQANNLRQVEDFYGSFRSFDVIRVKELSPRIRNVYVAMNYDKSPLFARFLLYRTETGWTLTSLKFHTSQEEILPTNLIP